MFKATAAVVMAIALAGCGQQSGVTLVTFTPTPAAKTDVAPAPTAIIPTELPAEPTIEPAAVAYTTVGGAGRQPAPTSCVIDASADATLEVVGPAIARCGQFVAALIQGGFPAASAGAQAHGAVVCTVDGGDGSIVTVRDVGLFRRWGGKICGELGATASVAPGTRAACAAAGAVSRLADSVCKLIK